MSFKFTKPQRNIEDPNAGGGGAAPMIGDDVAAQMLQNQGGGAGPDPGGQGAAPAGGDKGAGPDPGAGGGQGAAAGAFDESKWIADRFKGRFKTAEELDGFISKARTDDDDPEPVKELRSALKNGIQPKDYYKLATTDFDAMSDKQKWVFKKMQDDPEIKPEVAEALFEEEFPNLDHLEGTQKEVAEYKLKAAIKEAEQSWRDTQQKLLNTPGYKSAEQLQTEIQSKAQQIAEILNGQAQKLSELSVKIDRDAAGNPLPPEQVQEFKFKVSEKMMQEALAEAQNPFAAIANADTKPEDLAGMRLQQILFAKAMPDIVKVATDRAYQAGEQGILRRMNNGEFGAGFVAQPGQSQAAGSVAEEVAQQMRSL